MISELHIKLLPPARNIIGQYTVASKESLILDLSSDDLY